MAPPLATSYGLVAVLSFVCSSAAGAQVAASWMYLAETEADWWYTLPFASVDVLYLGPVGIQGEGKVGIHQGWEDRFRNVSKAARAANPGIQLVASQWWGQGAWGLPLSSLGDVSTYAQSVADLLQSFGFDGFDIDYEGNNVVGQFSELLAAIRKALHSGQVLTLSPATTQHFTQENMRLVDRINMQSYAGGSSVSVEPYTVDLGVPSSSILYGICPESHCSGPSADDACQRVATYKLGGVHNWRLNSDNHVVESQTQQAIYRKIHAGGCGGALARPELPKWV